MSELSEFVWLYFASSEETFWKWSADRQAIEWTDGQTIAFRSELQSLFAQLAGEGLPPFETILLTVAACRNRSEPKIQELLSLKLLNVQVMQFSLREHLTRVVDGLTAVSRLPEELRTSLDGKRAILELICEHGPSRKKKDFSHDCLNWLREGYDINRSMLPHSKPIHEWIKDLRGLHDGLAAVNETAVRLRMRTGVETLPVPVPLVLPILEPEPPPPLTIRELLRDLEQDDDRAGLVRLTRRLLSIVALPRPISAPDDQPLEGVSDITNRGPFDRLLLSELAHDSDILMTRVALNEAMYIRREMPPSFPPRERLVLVDAGIRMWGIPRLYATAAALALAVMQDEAAPTRMYRAADSLEAVDLTCREGLIQHLESLEVAAHPGLVLPDFIAEAEDKPAEIVIITGEDVLADPDFRVCLSPLQIANLYIIAVTREGDVRLLQRSRQGERILRQARLDLAQILAPPAKSAPKLRDESIDPHLPAICRVRPFPLYLNHQLDWDNCGVVHTENPALGNRYDNLLSVSYDRRLTLWSSGDIGPVELSDRLPPGKLLWHSSLYDPFDFDSEWRLVIGIAEQGRLSLVIIKDQQTEVIPLKLSALPVRGVSEHAGILYVAQALQLLLFSSETGNRLAAMNILPTRTWIRGRFFQDAQGQHAVAFNGQEAVWQQIHNMTLYNTVQTIFDCEFHASPIIVKYGNSVVIAGNDSVEKFQSSYVDGGAATIEETQIGRRKLTAALQVGKISADGNRFVLMDRSDKSSIQHGWLVDLEKRTASQKWGEPGRILNSTSLGYLSQKNLRNRFVAIAVHEQRLVLITGKNKLVALFLVEQGSKIQLKDLSANRQSVEHAVEFQNVRQPEGVGYELKVARWSDGSRAYLDSRGLLHLQSSLESIPEMTFVLHDDDVAGWSDRHLLWGDTSFTGGLNADQRVSAQKVFQEWLIAFVWRLK